MFIDYIFIKSPKEKRKLNFYLNDNNLYVKNSLKMRKKHLSYYNSKIKAKSELRKKYPVPKIIYSTSDLNFQKYKKNIVEKLNPKKAVKELMDVVNNFTDNFNFEDEEDEIQEIILDDDKNSKKENILNIDEKNIENNDKNDENKENKENKEYTEKEKVKNSKEFFLTNKNMFNNNKKKYKNKNLELLTDLEFAKSKSISEAITSPNDLQIINKNNKIFKNSLYFQNYGKFKFTKSGLLYPKKLGKYELPNYTGNNEEEKKYFDYRKKISKPNLIYNKISNFSEKFNKDLGKINNNYRNDLSRTRFTENPLMKKYMNIIPLYETYKDLKQIENRYIGSKFKFKLLPLYNKKLSNIDKLADRFYKTQNLKDGLVNLLNIQNASYDNKK